MEARKPKGMIATWHEEGRILVLITIVVLGTVNFNDNYLIPIDDGRYILDNIERQRTTSSLLSDAL